MSIRQSVGKFSATLVSVLRTRLELFSLEVQEQRAQLVGVLALAFAALVFVLLAVLVFSVAVALYFWPTEHRYLAMFLLALLYLLAAVGLGLVLRHRLLTAPSPFEATLDELRRDLLLVQRLKDTPTEREPGETA